MSEEKQNSPGYPDDKNNLSDNLTPGYPDDKNNLSDNLTPGYPDDKNNSPSYASPKTPGSQTRTQGKHKISPIDAIEEFYRLKNSYETSYYDKYIKPIIKKDKISKREKRVEYSKLPKNECINCKRQVGTMFSISNTSEQYKQYIARCGDVANPCTLDIQIEYSNRELYDTGIIDNLKKIEELKLKIIKEKNNALFFNKDVIGIFENLTNNIKDLTGITGFLIELNILKNHNPEKRNLLKKTIDEFGMSFIIPFKNMIAKYIETDNIQILNEATNFYIAEMLPKLKEIQKLKYSVNEIDYVEFYESEGSVYKLMQRANSLQDNEYALNEDVDKVIKFIKGGEQMKSNKTRKNKDKISKSKTKKNNPISNLVLEDEEQAEDESNDRTAQFSVEGKDIWESRWG
jgi:hypothetical protein